MKAKREAKDLLSYYFKLLFEKSGLVWTSDNRVEIEQIVDLIVSASAERLEERRT